MTVDHLALITLQKEDKINALIPDYSNFRRKKLKWADHPGTIYNLQQKFKPCVVFCHYTTLNRAFLIYILALFMYLFLFVMSGGLFIFILFFLSQF